MKRSLVKAGLLVLGSAIAAVSPALDVVTSSDANALISAALGTLAPGVSVTGASISGASGATGTYSNLSFGAFSSIASGMLLTTGDAQTAVGPNADDGAGTDASGPTGTYNLYDGTNSIDLNDVITLTVNFHVDAATNLSFDFAYGSEEYWFFTNSTFNDSFFAFLDNGTKTLALDTLGQAITINNQFLTIDNRPADFDPTNGYGLGDKAGTGTTAGINELQYDGFTPVLRTSFNVDAGDHSLTFVIGDAGDSILDSGVFISNLFGPGSGGEDTNPVPEPGTAAFTLLSSSGMIWAAMKRKWAEKKRRA